MNASLRCGELLRGKGAGMWFWQRREVYMGKDGPQLYAVRTALEQAGIGFECIVRSGRHNTGPDRRMTNAHSAPAGMG